MTYKNKNRSTVSLNSQGYYRSKYNVGRGTDVERYSV